MVQQQQAQQRKQQEGEVIRQSFVKNNGDIDKTMADVSQNPVVSPETLQALQLHSATLKKTNADATDAALKVRSTQIDRIRATGRDRGRWDRLRCWRRGSYSTPQLWPNPA